MKYYFFNLFYNTVLYCCLNSSWENDFKFNAGLVQKCLALVQTTDKSLSVLLSFNNSFYNNFRSRWEHKCVGERKTDK